MDLAKLKEKVKNLLSFLKAAPGKLIPQKTGPKAKNPKRKSRRSFDPAPIKKTGARLIGKIDIFLDPFLSRFPDEKRRPIMYGMGGLVVLLLILIISLAAHPGKPKATVQPAIAAGPFIPAEDLLLPAEPDFVPEFLLEREPRSSWSLEDIRPYWRSPGNPGHWRDEVKAAVDKIMEGVP